MKCQVAVKGGMPSPVLDSNKFRVKKQSTTCKALSSKNYFSFLKKDEQSAFFLPFLLIMFYLKKDGG